MKYHDVEFAEKFNFDEMHRLSDEEYYINIMEVFQEFKSSIYNRCKENPELDRKIAIGIRARSSTTTNMI